MELNYLSQEERDLLALQVTDPVEQAELLEWANHARHQAATVSAILKGEVTVQVDPELGVACKPVVPRSTRRPSFRHGLDGDRLAS